MGGMWYAYKGLRDFDLTMFDHLNHTESRTSLYVVFLFLFEKKYEWILQRYTIKL